MVSIIFVLGACDVFEKDEPEAEPHGLKVAVEIPQELVETEDVGILSVEGHIDIDKAVVTVKEKDGTEVETSLKDIEEGEYTLTVRKEGYKEKQIDLEADDKSREIGEIILEPEK